MVAFRCYNPTGAAAEARCAWRTPLAPEFDSEVDAQLELLGRDRTLEASRQFKELRGKCTGLTEIIIDLELGPDEQRKKAEKVHIRILGFGTADDFVLLYALRKRGGPDYGPACHAALNRKLGVQRDGWRARPCRFP
jgi:hypothetical protein